MGLRHEERWPSHLFTTLGPILGLLKDDSITEIEINAFDHVRTKGSGWRGHKRMEGVNFASREALMMAAQVITEVTNRVVNEDKPIYDGRLPGGERVNVAFPPFCENCAITIRKFPQETMTLERLVQHGAITEEIAEMLGSLVLMKKNILVSGGTNSGKTSLLNALSRRIPEDQRIVTVEDSRELQMIQENWVALETVEAYKEGMTAVTILMGVKNTLRQTPDRIIIGECRSEEAAAMTRAFSTGHSGGMTTVHAENGYEALEQIQLLAQYGSPEGVSEKSVARGVAKAIHFVIHVKQFEEDGSRKLVEIVEVEPRIKLVDGEIQYLTRTLLLFQEDGVSGDKGNIKVEGHWVYPQRPSERSRRIIHAKGLYWPPESLEAPDVAALPQPWLDEAPVIYTEGAKI